MIKSAIRRTMGYVGLVAANVVILGLILVVVEGFASYVLLARDIMWTRSIADSMAERRHTKYDPDLGWVNEPNLYIPNMYKPGVYLKTNSQGFRNNHDFDHAVPSGKYRIVCSGDSFTLGYGVDNDHTWCQLLTSFDQRLETLNMGQGGYGVDQAYLWYKRDGSKFEHQVHLLAFITADFERMQYDTFLGYGRPVIDIENNRLVVRNVPVPKQAYFLPWLTSNAQNLSRLRVVELFKRVSSKNESVRKDSSERSGRERNEKTQKVLRLLFQDLKRHNEARSSVLALVYLPTLIELKGDDPREWLLFIESESQALGIPFINVFSAFRALRYEDMLNMFGGHYSKQGNEFVARLIYDEFKNHPAICHVLSLHRPNGSQR